MSGAAMAKKTTLRVGSPVTPSVATVRKELQDAKQLYKLIDDVIAGSVKVKAAKTVYLPDPSSGRDNGVERYKAYITRAVFYAVTRRTLEGFVGELFDKDPVITMPTVLEPLVEDATGEGVGAVQLAKKVAKLTLSLGRCGLFVDFPETGGSVTRADLSTGVRPVIKHYHPTKIINWRFRKIGAVSRLSLVVLEEEYDAEDDGFTIVRSTQWRVLRLNEYNQYTVQIFQKTKSAGTIIDTGVITPLDAEGNPFEEIPFKFVGSETNDAEIDYPPMFDMADLNIAHYRNSADHEETLFVGSQPTPVITGLTESWAEKFFKDGVALGTRAAIPLPVGGDATLLEPSERSAILAEMEHKEKQMVALGAKLVEQKSVQRTATETSVDAASEKSTLANVSGNVSNAFEWAFYFAGKFVGVADDKVVFQLNKEFSINFSSPEARKEAIEAWVTEAISFTEMRMALKKGGTAVLPDDVAKAEIEGDRETLGRTPGGIENVDDDPDADPEDNPDDPNSVSE